MTQCGTRRSHRGGGLVEVLIALLLASGTLLPLLRMHLMSTIHLEEQRLLTLASLAANDLQERLRLVHSVAPQEACAARCEAEYRVWRNQWQANAPKLLSALLLTQENWAVEIAWPAHPLVPVNAKCELSSACIHAQGAL